jgi:hypothetical protein
VEYIFWMISNWESDRASGRLKNSPHVAINLSVDHSFQLFRVNLFEISSYLSTGHLISCAVEKISLLFGRGRADTGANLF